MPWKFQVDIQKHEDGKAKTKLTKKTNKNKKKKMKKKKGFQRKAEKSFSFLWKTKNDIIF